MSVEAEIDIDVLEALDFDIDKTCEHSSHAVLPKFHSDEGSVWLRVAGKCPNCGRKASNIMACNKWKSLCDAGVLRIRCNNHCGEYAPVSDWGYGWVKV